LWEGTDGEGAEKGPNGKMNKGRKSKQKGEQTNKVKLNDEDWTNDIRTIDDDVKSLQQLANNVWKWQPNELCVLSLSLSLSLFSAPSTFDCLLTIDKRAISISRTNKEIVAFRFDCQSNVEHDELCKDRS
jgi:hypothetical protein